MIVKWIICIGGYVIGVEVECNCGGYVGVVNLILNIGCVILVVGVFGFVKLLFRSKFLFVVVVLKMFVLIWFYEGGIGLID